MKKILEILVLTSTLVLFAFAAMLISSARTNTDQNSIEASSGATFSATPFSENVSPIKTLVEPSVSKVIPIEIVGNPTGSASNPPLWPYIFTSAGCGLAILTAFAIRKRKNKLIRFRYLSLLFLVNLILLTSSVHAEETLTVSRWNLDAIGVNVPMIGRDSVDSVGNVWFGDFYSNRIGVLNPLTGEVKLWVTPEANNRIATISIDKNDKVWFIDTASRRIGRFDPSTNMFTLWPVSGLIYAYFDFIWPFALPIISFDSNGYVYFPLNSTNGIARLNAITNELTEWPIPTQNSGPAWTMVDKNDNVWFLEYFGNKIACLNPFTNEITEWPIPTADSRPQGLYVIGTQVFFTEWKKIGCLNPVTNEVTEWYLDWLGQYYASGIIIDSSGNAWFRTEGWLLKLSPSNIFTYWLISSWCGWGVTLSVDRNGISGGIYTVGYRRTGWPLPAWGPYGDIVRFQPLTT